MRVVLDTDVVVAGLRSPRGASRAWLQAALRRGAELLLSVPLVLEYEAVLLRPETLATMRLGAAEIGRLLDALRARQPRGGLLPVAPDAARPGRRDGAGGRRGWAPTGS